ncbi:unnamed protein product [Echinostoma caproni]|uniref:BSD domain-containing protein n=1 Tax=Echinostoma caproni TaxID=27848 RepID=A0A183ANG9_9TREM|nr:unnamed protein product [Echinostoma caproni]
MKQDFGEVVSVVSKEPRDTVSRTASSVRQRITAMADAALKLDPSEFSLLPETSGDQENRLAPEDKVATPPNLSELPSLSSIRSDVSHLFTGFVSSLFGADDEQQTRGSRDRREARLQIIRADPATYEREPATPPAHLGVHSYADWRAAYFDETTCQPRPGIPLCGARNPANDDQPDDALLEPPHPSPEELLDKYPFMRTYLTQLVRVDGQLSGKGLTDADFWSRYYYHVWLLDVTERRRQKLAARVASTTTLKATGGIGTADRSSESVDQADGANRDETNDWFVGDSDAEDSVESKITQGPTIPFSQPLPTETANSTDSELQASAVKLLETHAAAHAKGSKSTGKSRRKRVKKRSGSNINDVHLHGSESLVHPMPDQESSVATTTVVEVEQAKPVLNFPTPSEPTTSSELVGVPRPIGESDDFFTSGSSSVVVLSNSEDEPDLQLSNTVMPESAQVTAVGEVTSNISEMNIGKHEIVRCVYPSHQTD